MIENIMYRNVVLVRWFGIFVTILCGLCWMRYYWSRHPTHPTVMQSLLFSAAGTISLMVCNIMINLIRAFSPESWGWRRPDSSLYNELERTSLPHMTLCGVLSVVYYSGLMLFACLSSLSGQQVLSFYVFCCVMFVLCIWDWYDPVPNPPAPPNAGNNCLIAACICVLSGIINFSVSPSVALELGRMTHISNVMIGLIYPVLLLCCWRERHDLKVYTEDSFVETLEISITFVYVIGLVIVLLISPYQEPILYDLPSVLTVTIAPTILFMGVAFTFFNVFKGNTVDILTACLIADNLKDVLFHGFNEERVVALFLFNVAMVFRLMGTTPGGSPSEQELAFIAQLDEMSLSLASTPTSVQNDP